MSAFPFAQKYLKDYHRPPVLPITRVSEGNEPLRFTSLWSGPEKSCWGKEVGDVRFKSAWASAAAPASPPGRGSEGV